MNLLKQFKKGISLVMSVAMIGTLMSGYAVRSVTVKAATELHTYKVSGDAFVTSEELAEKDRYSFDKDKSGKTQTISFGKNNQEWYILGGDGSKNITLFSKSTMFESSFSSGSFYPTDDYSHTGYLSYLKQYGTYDSASMVSGCSKLCINHYGASKLRYNLNSDENLKNYFSDDEIKMLVPTKIKSYDYMNKLDYSTEDRLYLPDVDDSLSYMQAGANNEYKIDRMMNEVASYYTRKSYIDSGSGIYRYICEKDYNNNYNSRFAETFYGSDEDIRPVCCVNVTDVLLASVIDTSHTGYSDSLKLRYKDVKNELGDVSLYPDQTRINLANNPTDTCLVIQSADKYWTMNVKSCVDKYGKCISASDLTGGELESFSDCHVWIEKKVAGDDKVIASIAEPDDKYDVENNMFDVVMSDCVYDERPHGAHISVKDGIYGMGEMDWISYYKRGGGAEKKSSPSEPGTYDVYIVGPEGANYKSYMYRYMGSYTIKALVDATMLSYKGPSNLSYNGSEKRATVSAVDSNAGLGNITVKYKDSDGNAVKQPIEPGSYTVYADVSESAVYASASDLEMGSFTIRKDISADNFIFTAPKDKVYRQGETKAAEVEIKPGVTGLGSYTVKYKFHGQEDYLDTLPEEAGNYDVYVSVSQGDRYYAGDVKVGSFTIFSEITDELVYTAPESLIVDGTPKEASVVKKQGVTGMGDITVKYKLQDSDTYIEGKPVETGHYEVYVDVTEGSGYVAANDIYMGSFTLRETPQADDFEYVSENYIYNGFAKFATVNIKSGINGMGKLSLGYKKAGQDEYLNNEPISVGEYEVYARVEQGDRYTAAVIKMGEFQIKYKLKSDMLNINLPTSDVQDGSVRQATVTTDGLSGFGDITVKYKANQSEAYLQSAPVEAGEYRVYVNMTEGTDYFAISDLYVGSFSIFSDNEYLDNNVNITYPQNTEYDGTPKIIEAKYMDNADKHCDIVLRYYSVKDGVKSVNACEQPIEPGIYRVYLDIKWSKEELALGQHSSLYLSTYLTEYEIQNKAKQFATKADLMSKFGLSEGLLTEKIKFGTVNGKLGGEWYVTGTDKQNDSSLTLLSYISYGSSYFTSFCDGYGDDKWSDFFEYGADYDSANKYLRDTYYLEDGSKKPDFPVINSNVKSYLGKYESSNDYFSNYEMSLMKNTTVTSTFPNINMEYETHSVGGKLYIPDAKDINVAKDGERNTYVYTGRKNNIKVDLNRVASVRYDEYSDIYIGIEDFALRSYSTESNQYEKYSMIACINKTSNSNNHVSSNFANMASMNILPAVNLDVSSVIFASDVDAVTSSGSLSTDEAMTLRYEDTDNSLGSGILSGDKSKVMLSGISAEDEYLVVRSSNGAWSWKVTGNGEVNSSDIDNSLTTFDDCQVWLEKTDYNQRRTEAVVITSTKDINEDIPDIDDKEVMKSGFAIDSTLTTGSSVYEAEFVSNYAGKIDVYDENNRLVAGNISINPIEKIKKVNIALSMKNGDNKYTAVFEPYSDNMQGSLLGEFETLEKTPTKISFTVSYRQLRTTENVIYVSGNGTADGDGSKSSPVDIYTAVGYAKSGQYIVVKDDVKVDRELVLDKSVTLMSEKSALPITIFNTKPLNSLVTISGDYVHLFNINLSSDNGEVLKAVTISGSHNTVERVNVNICNSGIHIVGNYKDLVSMWPSDNKVISCCVVNSGSNTAQYTGGFVTNAALGENNEFNHCIASHNIRGFVLGESDSSIESTIKINECIAYANKTSGFGINGNMNSDIVNCIAYSNFNEEQANMPSYGVISTSTAGSFKNCTFYNNKINIFLNAKSETKTYNWNVENCISYEPCMYTSWDMFTGEMKEIKSKDVFGSAATSDSYINSHLSDKANYLYDTVADSAIGIGTAAGTNAVTLDWFQSLDLDVEPTIKTDGNIELNGLLKLTYKAPAGIGAVITDITGTDISVNVDECESHNAVDGICTVCHKLINNPSKSDIDKLVSDAGEYIVSEVTYTTSSMNTLKEARTAANQVAEGATSAVRQKAYNSLAGAIAALVEADCSIVLNSSPVDSGILSGGGRYETGEEIRIKADTVNGYTFKGWYEGSNTEGEPYYTNNEFDYIVKSDVEVVFTAKYEANENKKLSVQVGNGKVECDCNSYKEEPWEEDVTDREFAKGSYLTLTAIPQNDVDFLYWINAETGRILTDSKEYSFYTGNDLKLKACYRQTEPGSHYIIFKDMNGSVLWSGNVADGETPQAPVTPVYNGLTFTGWDKNYTKVSEDTVVTAVYSRVNGLTVSVTGGSVKDEQTSYSYGDIISVDADIISGTQFFSGWYIGDKLMSTDNTYSFRITANTSLTARYDSETIIENSPVVTLDIGNRTEIADNKQTVTMNVNWNVPSEYTFIEAGLVRTYNEPDKNRLIIDNADGSVIKKNTSKLNTMSGTYAYTLTMGAVSKGKNLYACGYIIYRNNRTGEVSTIYTDVQNSDAIQ